MRSRPHNGTRLAMLLLPILLAGPAFAAGPTTLGLSGSLSSGAGPVADGTYKLTFRLFASALGGKVLWQEGPLDVTVASGRFGHALGSSKPLTAKILAGAKQGWLTVQVGNDPPLPARPLHAVAWALRASEADAVACSGCIGDGHLAGGSISASKVGFTYAGSSTKGGPATSAKVATDLKCTGCVSVAELKIDGDLDLGGNALKAAKIAATAIAAGQVAATTFVGDGSKLTGIKVPAGMCKNKGEVVKGINPDGSLSCIPGTNADALPADALDEISNGQLTTEFLHETSNTKAVPIPDNNPIGASSDIVLPDVGTAKGIVISVDIASSDISQVEVTVFDPNKGKFVLHSKTGKGKVLKSSWPTPTKTVSGDLSGWIGKNPKGTWRLKVVDSKFVNNGSDGAIKSWSIAVQTLSNKKVEAKGLLLTSGGLQLLSATKAPVACDAAHFGFLYANPETKSIFVCNGDAFYPISLITLGTKAVPAASCKDLLAKVPLSATGVYWLDPDGKGPTAPFRAYCDMVTDGGGWTLVWSNRRGGTGKHETNMKWNTAINTPPLTVGALGEDLEKFQVYTGLKHWIDIATGAQLRYTWAHNFGKPIDQSYRCNFKLDPKNAYTISFSGCKQLVGKVAPGLVAAHNGKKFTTSDKDNDTYGQNCASHYSGSPWWYTACWSGNINGGGQGGNGYQNAAYWTGSANADGKPDGSGGGNGWIFVR